MATYNFDLRAGIDLENKEFTDARSVALCILMWNAFNGSNAYSRMKLRGDSNPQGPRMVCEFRIPAVLKATSESMLSEEVFRLIQRPDVVAVLHHPGIDVEHDYRTIILIMRSDEDALRFVGMFGG